jgi:flagellar biosynthesis protein FlhB
MLKHEIALTKQELKILQEVQQQLGLPSIEATIEFLARERIQEKMLDLAGEEIKRKRHL